MLSEADRGADAETGPLRRLGFGWRDELALGDCTEASRDEGRPSPRFTSPVAERDMLDFDVDAPVLDRTFDDLLSASVTRIVSLLFLFEASTAALSSSSEFRSCPR